MCGLTPAHDQRSAARAGKPTVRRLVVPARHQRTAAPWLLHADVRRRQGSCRGCAGVPRGHRDRRRLDRGPAGGRRGLRWRSPARSAASRPGPLAGARLARPRWVPSRLGCGGHGERSMLIQCAAWAAWPCAGPVSHSRRHASLGSASPPSNAPHHLRGRGKCASVWGKPAAGASPPNNPLAAPRQVHAVVIRRFCSDALGRPT